MELINAIVDLARTLEPATPDPQFEFHLTYDPKTKGWRAQIQLRACWYDVTGKSPEDVIQQLHDQLLHMNQTILQRVYNRITRWAKKTISPLTGDGSNDP